MAGTASLLVVGTSARALAAAAARSGFMVAAIDFFADQDTRAIAVHAEALGGSLEAGFSAADLMPAVERALAALATASGAPPLGAVVGSGFEDRVELLASLGARVRLIGCSPEAVAAAKSDAFDAACRDLGVPRPQRAAVVPRSGSWLLRRRTGTGGIHIRIAEPGPVPADSVAERWMPGRPVSVAVLASGDGAAVLGFTEQWPAPTRDAPFRFAGVCGPIRLPAVVNAGLTRAAARLAARLGLVGLVSFDALVDGDDWWLLEINPRPGASIDVLDRTEPALLACHVAAAEGRLLVPRQRDATIGASLVVYAATDTSVPAGVDWPAWVLDRPGGGLVPPGAPIATVVAFEADAVTARRVVDDRAQDLRRRLSGVGTDG